MKHINPGVKAPLFKTIDIWQNAVKFPEGNWIYLSFHRFSACPLCNLRTHELIKSYNEFKENNIEILSIWPSNRESMIEYVGKSDAPFPLIADPEWKLFKMYGVLHRSNIPMKGIGKEPRIWIKALKYKFKNFKVDGDGKLHPAGFLVSPDRIVRVAYYGKHFGDHMAIDDIIDYVKTYNYDKESA